MCHFLHPPTVDCRHAYFYAISDLLNIAISLRTSSIVVCLCLPCAHSVCILVCMAIPTIPTHTEGAHFRVSFPNKKAFLSFPLLFWSFPPFLTRKLNKYGSPISPFYFANSLANNANNSTTLTKTNLLSFSYLFWFSIISTNKVLIATLSMTRHVRMAYQHNQVGLR